MFELAICDFERNLEKLRELYPVKTICMHGSPLSEWDNRDLWKRYNYRDFGIIAEPYFDVDFKEILYWTDTGRRWDGDAFNIRDKVETLELQKEGWIPSESGMDGGLDGWMNSLREWMNRKIPAGLGGKDKRDGWMNSLREWMNRMIPVGLGGRQKAESVIRNEELGIRKKTMNEKLGLRFRSTRDIIEAAEKGLLPDKIMLNVHPQRWMDNPLEWTKELVWQNVKNVIKRYFYVKMWKS